MRKGQNPAKLGVSAYRPRSLGVAVLIHIPSQEGYFADSWEIFRYQLASLQANTSEAFDLLVFDNGSCPEIQENLHRLHMQGRMQWLWLSRENLGKTGALNAIFGAIPNEWICYADSDVLFRPGWLEASRALMTSFPNAGLVTAQPCFFDILRGEGKAHEALARDTRFEFGETSPEAGTVEEYCRGIGASAEQTAEHRKRRLATVTNKETKVSAVMGASHMQFLVHRDVIRRVLPLPSTKGLDRGEDSQLNSRIDQQGLLQLSTQRAFVIHMGNEIDEWLRKQVVEVEPSLQPVRPGSPMAEEEKSVLYRTLASLADHPRLRWRLARLYRTLYEVFAGR